MKKRLSIKNLIVAIVVAAFIGGMAQAQYGAYVGYAVAALILAVNFAAPYLNKFIVSNTKGAAAGISVEVWQDHIEGNLFKNNEFLLASTDASQYVIQGKIVHIPQAGATPGTEKNRSSLPAEVSQRTDTDVTYQLDAYTTDPILLPNAESFELSYNKRESVLSEHEDTLRERIADELLIKWAPTVAGNITRTTGDATDTYVTDTTGSRKKFTVSDLKTAQKMLNKQKMPKNDRYALFSADAFDQFLDDFKITQNRDFSQEFDAKTGVIGKLYGFNIMVRSDVVLYNAGATAVNAYGAATAEDDNDAVLCWQKNAIERAVGNVKMFGDVDDPTYYGDIYSFEVRMGGRRRRDDSKGIVAIVQADGDSN